MADSLFTQMGSVIATAIDNTQLNVTNEIATRAADDIVLQTNINNEAVARATADNTLQTNINNEAVARAAADTILQTNIDAITFDTMVGDTGSGGTAGLVPAPASGDAAASKFLKADGTWTIVEATGGGGGLLGYGNWSAKDNSTTFTLNLTTPAAGVGKCAIALFKEVAGAATNETTWDIAANETGWHGHDYAVAQTLTPSAISGEMVTFTLGGGAWPATIEGYQLVNVSAGETGKATIIAAISGTVVKAKITTAFTNTGAIASGDWRLYASQFTTGAPGEVQLGTNPTGGIDRYTTLMIQSEAANGNAVFNDTSSSATAITTYGAVTHSSNTAKFGASSIRFPSGSASDYLSVADAASNRLSRSTTWTIDFWFYPSVNGYHTVLNKEYYQTGINGGWCVQIANNGSNGTHFLNLAASNGLTSNSYMLSNTNLTIPPGAWYHVEIAHEGAGVLKFYLNGNAVGSSTVSASYNLDAAVALVVGSKYAGTIPPNGYLEEVRISQGVVRHTAGFTPPTVPYSVGAMVTGQYVATISDQDQIDTSGWVDINGVTVTETLNSGNAYYAISQDGRTTWHVVKTGQTPVARNIASSLNSVHGGTEGNWYWNYHPTYGSSNWTPRHDDPYTTMLIQSETTNGSNTFTDSSYLGKTVTAYGNAQHATAQAKFGASSMSFGNQIGDYILVADDAGTQLDYTNPWTIDFWGSRTAANQCNVIRKGFWTVGVNGGWGVAINTSGGAGTHKLLMQISTGQTVNQSIGPNNLTINTGTWYHFAVVHEGSGALKFYQNGVHKATETITTNPTAAVDTRIGGDNANGAAWDGYLEEIRISKGVARWTGNFTPPVAPYLTGVIENSPQVALQAAMANTTNRMAKAQLEAVQDSEYTTLTGTLDGAVILYAATASANPTVDKVEVNYDSTARQVLDLVNYEVEMPDVNTVKVTTPASGGPHTFRMSVL